MHSLLLHPSQYNSHYWTLSPCSLTGLMMISLNQGWMVEDFERCVCVRVSYPRRAAAKACSHTKKYVPREPPKGEEGWFALVRMPQTEGAIALASCKVFSLHKKSELHCHNHIHKQPIPWHTVVFSNVSNTNRLNPKKNSFGVVPDKTPKKILNFRRDSHYLSPIQ